MRLNPKVPAELEHIINRALEKDRELRYQHASEMRSELQRLKRDTEIGRAIAAGSGMVAVTQERSSQVAAQRPSPASGSASALAPSSLSGVKVAEVPVAGRKLWKVLAFAAVIFIAAAIAVSFYFRSVRTSHRLTEKDTIVLADFANNTGDAVFDDTLKQGLSVQLEQSPFLELVSERKVNETLKLMGRPAGDRLTPEVTREVCQRTGSKAMLTGSIAGLGSQYVIGLKAVNCDTGDVLAEAQEQAAGKEAVLKALDAAAVSMRSKLGESLSSVQKYATPLEEATTPSLEALKAYSLGQKTHVCERGPRPLCPSTNGRWNSIRISQCPTPLMAVAYGNLNEAGRAAENARKAYELREKVSERERLSIEANYYLIATGELEKAAQVYELWQQTYPRDVLPYADLGFILRSLGNWEKALEEAREAMRLEPNNAVNYVNLGNEYMSLNRLDEAEAVYKQAEERKLEGEVLLEARYELAFLKGDTAQMAQLVSAAMGKPGTEDLLLAAQADTEGLVREVEKCTRADPAGNGFGPAQRRQRDCCDVSGRGSAARGGIGQPGAGARRCRCGIEAGSEPRRAGDGGAGSGAGRRYGRGGETGGRTRQGIPAGHAGPEVLAAHDPGGCRLAAQRPEPGNRTVEGGERDRTWPAHAGPFPVPGLFAGRSLSHAARRQRGGSGISEVHRPLRAGGELSLGSAGPPRPGSRLRPMQGDARQSPRCISGFPHPLERRRSRHPHPEASQSRVREAAVTETIYPRRFLSATNCCKQAISLIDPEIGAALVNE